MNSVVIIIPAELKATALKVAWALGFQEQAGDSFSMPASVSGSLPSHWYARGQAGERQTLLLQAAKAGQIPAKPAVGEWADYGLVLADLQAFAAALIVDLQPYTADFDLIAHMGAALAANGLRAVPAADRSP